MKSEILTMVDFYKRKNKDYPGYEYPTVPGTFSGKLSVLHWATHAIIHSLWVLEDGRKVDCVLFKDNGYCGIEKISIGDNVELFFQKTSSGNVYLREIKTRVSEERKRHQWSTATDSELYEGLNKLSADKRIPKSRLLDEAIADLLIKYGKLNQNNEKVIKL